MEEGVLEGAPELFERGSSTKKPAIDESEAKTLHAKIGELTVANGTSSMRDIPGITISF